MKRGEGQRIQWRKFLNINNNNVVVIKANDPHQYGYVRNETELMWFTIILLVIIVQVFQEVGMLLAKKFDHRINK